MWIYRTKSKRGRMSLSKPRCLCKSLCVISRQIPFIVKEERNVLLISEALQCRWVLKIVHMISSIKFQVIFHQMNKQSKIAQFTVDAYVQVRPALLLCWRLLTVQQGISSSDENVLDHTAQNFLCILLYKRIFLLAHFYSIGNANPSELKVQK